MNQRLLVHRLIRSMVLGAAGLTFLGAAAVSCLFWYCSRDLPSLSQLESYDPPQISRVFAADGSVIGEFGKMRRKVVPAEEIPPMVLNAFVAAEDASFFQHRGLDYYGIFRAFVANLTSLRLRQGASTISQQVLKNLLLLDEHSLIRKVKEALLVSQMEELLSKRQILGLYVNEIDFGNNTYGVAEASRFYFNSKLKDLDIGQIAYLAGLPKNPYGYALNRHPEKAKKRQRYVLGRLLELDYIDRETFNRFEPAPLVYRPPEDRKQRVPYAVDQVMREIKSRIDEKELNRGGLSITTDIDPGLQHAARMALRANLRNYDKRHGYRPLPVINRQSMDRWRARIHTVAKSLHSLDKKPILAFSAELPPRHLDKPVDGDELQKSPPPLWNTLVQNVSSSGLYYGFVQKIETNGDITVDLGKNTGRVKAGGAAWAIGGRLSAEKLARRIHETFQVGQLVVISPTENFHRETEAGDVLPLLLEQKPEAQSAMVVIDPQTRAIRAMVGGFNYYLSPFNRATQAKRQPGSSFKAFVYLSAILSGEFTPASLIEDAPIVFPNPGGKAWRPKNYDGKFRGFMRLRQAMANSINIVAIKLMEKVGIKTVIDTAKRLGIKENLKPNLTLALGSSEVPLVQMTNAYASFPAGGRYDDAYLIKKVVSADGRVLMRRVPDPRQAISESEAGMMVSLMRSVVEEGTSVRAKVLGRPVAGKTGTANDQRDAWFIGYTPDLVCGVWVGYDDHRPLGRGETGSRAALPAWIEFMRTALAGSPAKPFPAVSGLVHVWINPESGKRVDGDFPDAMMEVFMPGSEPEFEHEQQGSPE